MDGFAAILPPGSTMTPSPPDRSDSDLQPRLRARLAEAKRAAQNLEQRQADVALVTRAALAGFDGPDWYEIVGELANYGWGVAFGWIRGGRMQAKCRDAGRPCPKLHPSTRQAEWAESLATDLVVESIGRFRDEVLIPAQWDPTQGATLKSFFVGQMLKQFANVYRRWFRDELGTALNTEPLDDTRPSELSTERTALDRAAMAEELDQYSVQVQQVARLIAQDRTRSEISEVLGISIAAIDSILYRLRQNHVA